ncbi:MAG: LacI family DNA-binding transcriptional regulator [Burkholderiaceae bacterium]
MVDHKTRKVNTEKPTTLQIYRPIFTDLMNASLKRPTLADVAKLAEVSLGTASRALSIPERVKPKTLEKVNAVVTKLGYVRNGAAQALASKKTQTVAAIFPTINNPVYASSINALEQALWRLGYQLLIASHEYHAVPELKVVRTMLERGVDGLILVGTDHDESVYTLIKLHGTPCVLFWSLDETNYPHCIGFSNHLAAYNMAKLVLAKGHTKIAICSGSTWHNERARTRITGTLDALAEAGVDVPAPWIIKQPFSFDGGRNALKELWSKKKRPTALICGTDLQAIGALHECQLQNIHIPTDLSITGFDDIEYASITTPSLTTVHVPTSEIGARAAKKIIDLINGKDHSRKHLSKDTFVATIIERDSLGPITRSGQRR